MSYSSAWWRVRTSTDSPCPTSITTSSASPCSGKSRSGHSSGSHSSSGQRLARHAARQQQPERAQQRQWQREPARLRQPPQRQAAVGQPLEQRPSSGRSTTPPRARPTRPHPACSASSAMPISDSGTTTRLHHGTATRLANGPANDAWPNRIALSGSSPSVATPCADRKSRTGRALPCGRHHSSQATPRKLSQKPAPSTASGSSSSTAITASASASAARNGRRHSPRAGNHRDHQHRAHGRQREPGDRRVQPARRASPPAPPRSARGQRRASAGHSHHRPRASKREEAGDQADMEAGNRDQVGQAVGAQACPSRRRRRPRVSPSASARTNREDGAGTAAAMRGGHRLRARPGVPSRPTAGCARAGSRTYPVAAMRCASACFSLSKPPGLRNPRGARTPHQQTPALAGLERRCGRRRSCRRTRPTAAACPRNGAGWAASASTRNRKRVRRGSCSGRSAMRPLTTTSRCSQSAGNWSASAWRRMQARQPEADEAAGPARADPAGQPPTRAGAPP